MSKIFFLLINPAVAEFRGFFKDSEFTELSQVSPNGDAEPRNVDKFIFDA
jgi:hypothetical protein